MRHRRPRGLRVAPRRGLRGTEATHRAEAQGSLDEAAGLWPDVARLAAQEKCDDARKTLFTGIQLAAMARCHLEGGEIRDADLHRQLHEADRSGEAGTQHVVACYGRAVGTASDEWAGRIEFGGLARHGRKRRRWRGLAGRPVEHFVELPAMAEAAGRSFDEAIYDATASSVPTLNACASALRALAKGVGYMAGVKCLGDETAIERLHGDERVEVEEARPFLISVSVDAVIEKAREARYAVDACYRRVGVEIHRPREESAGEPALVWPPAAGRIEF